MTTKKAAPTAAAKPKRTRKPRAKPKAKAPEPEPDSNGYLLLLSGGAARGAFQVPIIEGLLRDKGLPGAVVGTSVGAGHAAAVSSLVGSTAPRKVWNQVDGSKSFQAFQVDFWNGAFSLRRYRKLLQAQRVEQLRLPCFVGVYDLQEGKHELVHLNPLSYATRLDWVVASASQPLMHERADVDRRWYADGGICNVIPPFPDYADFDEVHVVSCFPESVTLPALEPKQVNSGLEQADRALDEMLGHVMRRDIKRIKSWANFKPVTLYAPPTWDAIGPAFDAKRERISERLELGQRVYESASPL